MKLQALTICVNYSDFFLFSILENRKQFDRWVVVTDLTDVKTKELCEKYSLLCIQTDVFYTKGVFNKFAAMNVGLEYIDDDAWVVFLDGDIILHHQTKRVLECLTLKEDCIYGIDRLNCKGYIKWMEYKSTEGMLINYWLLHPSGLEMGARLVHLYGYENGDGKFKGWGPVGYFQLVHRSSFTLYPEDSLGADHCDLLFSREYDREKRILIPELFCIHLESENAKKGQNWRGRKTAPFIDSLPIVPYRKPCSLKKKLLKLLFWFLSLFKKHKTY